MGIIFFLPGIHKANNGPLPKGSFLFRLYEWWSVSDHHFNRDGNREINIVEYGYYATNIYAAHGFTDRLSGFMSFPVLNYAYTQVPSTLQKKDIWKPGDIEAGISYTVLNHESLDISSKLILGIPAGYHQDDALMTGDGEFNQALVFDVLNRLPFFEGKSSFGVYSGYNLRSAGYANEILYGGRLGFHFLKDQFDFMIRANGIHSTSDDVALHVNPQSYFSNQRSYFSIAPELNYHIDASWGLQIGTVTWLWGKNHFAGTGFTLGISYQQK